MSHPSRGWYLSWFHERSLLRPDDEPLDGFSAPRQPVGIDHASRLEAVEPKNSVVAGHRDEAARGFENDSIQAARRTRERTLHARVPVDDHPQIDVGARAAFTVTDRRHDRDRRDDAARANLLGSSE